MLGRFSRYVIAARQTGAKEFLITSHCFDRHLPLRAIVDTVDSRFEVSEVRVIEDLKGNENYFELAKVPVIESQL